MSTETTVRCDRCREVITTGRAQLRLEAGAPLTDWPIDHESGRPAIDLCPTCCKALAAWVRAGVKTPVEAQR
jgi:hypothetical protein